MGDRRESTRASDESSIVVAATKRRVLSEEENVVRYTGTLSPQWNHGNVPNGGYSLGTVLHCAQDAVVRKRGAENANLFICMASYHSKVNASVDYLVEVRLLKRGRGTTSVEADLRQKTGKDASDQLCIRVQLVYANFDALRSDKVLSDRFSIDHTSPYASRFPLTVDPSDTSNLVRWYKPHSQPLVMPDRAAVEKAKRDGELITAKYIYFPRQHVDQHDIARHNNATIAMYCDMTAEPGKMMPEGMLDVAKELMGLWFPTMSLNIEIRHPLPTSFPIQRVAAMAKTTHLQHGQWRFDVEIWSHPLDAEAFGLSKDGPQSVLLAVSQQTALTYSMAVNRASKM